MKNLKLEAFKVINTDCRFPREPTNHSVLLKNLHWIHKKNLFWQKASMNFLILIKIKHFFYYLSISQSYLAMENSRWHQLCSWSRSCSRSKQSGKLFHTTKKRRRKKEEVEGASERERTRFSLAVTQWPKFCKVIW